MMYIHVHVHNKLYIHVQCTCTSQLNGFTTIRYSILLIIHVYMYMYTCTSENNCDQLRLYMYLLCDDRLDVGSSILEVVVVCGLQRHSKFLHLLQLRAERERCMNTTTIHASSSYTYMYSE